MGSMLAVVRDVTPPDSGERAPVETESAPVILQTIPASLLPPGIVREIVAPSVPSAILALISVVSFAASTLPAVSTTSHPAGQLTPTAEVGIRMNARRRFPA